MSTMLDVIGGLLIFGLVVLMTLQLNIFTMEKNVQGGLQAMSMESVTGTESNVGLGGIIESDLAKIGVGDSISPSILVAEAERITFRGDFDGNGSIDSLKYYLTVPGSIPSGGNPGMKYLYRRQNAESGTKGWFGVSSWQLAYMDSMGRTIAAPVQASQLPSIRSIRVKLTAESNVRLKNSSDTTFAATYWETIVSPKNVQ